MSNLALRAALAVALNAAAAIVAVRKQAVTAAGGVTGFVLGAGIFAGGGLWLWSLLMIFFGSGSLVSRVGSRSKRPLQRLHQKGSRRDPLQVLANGGVGLLAAVGYGISGNPALAMTCAASFAVSSADTWAGEIGVLNPSPPRSIVTGRPLVPGASGGVTLLGMAAAAVGAALIAVVFAVGWAVRYGRHSTVALTVVVTAAGFGGALLDSLLGATVQAHYADTCSGEVTERSQGSLGENRLIRGWRGFNNDAVNAVSNLAVSAALLAFVL